jgi:hypothetical protein
VAGEPEPLPVVAAPEDDPDAVFCVGVGLLLEQAPPKLAAARATNPDVARPKTRVVFEVCKLMDIAEPPGRFVFGGRHSRSRRHA